MPSTPSIEVLTKSFAAAGYIADRDLATAIHLSLALQRPLLLEGEAGVGKTEVARTLAAATGAELIRLQCYEGLDVSTAMYEWDYPRQMLAIRLLEAQGRAADATPGSIFTSEYLVRRPLLRALESTGTVPPVLLIDEIDRADEEFEAFLLEILADFAITIPEIGTITAKIPPRVIVTSNRTREVHDALKRRCLYHWIDYPTPERELAILLRRMPDLPKRLAAQVVAFVQALRGADLAKLPGIAETLDWAAALVALDATVLTGEQINRTLGALLKYQEDLVAIRGEGAERMLQVALAGLGK
ncbi:MAG: AAA family ATPase [Gemmatimonadales bacterium]